MFTVAKLKFSVSQGLKNKVEFKLDEDRTIGNLAAVNLKKEVWIYYLPNDEQEGFFQIVDQDELKPKGEPLQCGWLRISTLKASVTDNLIFSGYTNGDIIIWETTNRVIKQHFTGINCKPVTCLA